MSSRSRTYKNQGKKTAAITSALLLSTMMLSAVSGCTTTQEFKPTASVLAGAHKPL
ncbi:hypothetical protein AAJP47_07260 [Psychrobacter sp. B38]|uniref:hypothetical protein n=1 Tax=Psychrobacter sp. B38 TaxID=3143538 RepID=UPI0032117B20